MRLSAHRTLASLTAALPFGALVLVTLHSMHVQNQTAKPATWKLVPDLRIGSIDDTDYSLTSVGGIAIGADGTMYVSQPLDRQIVMFDRRSCLAESGDKAEVQRSLNHPVLPAGAPTLWSFRTPDYSD